MAYTLPPAWATDRSGAREATNIAVFRAPRRVAPLAAAAASAAATLAAEGGRLLEAAAAEPAAAAVSALASAGMMEGL